MDNLDQYQHIKIILLPTGYGGKTFSQNVPAHNSPFKSAFFSQNVVFSSRELFGLMGANLNRNVIVTGGSYAGKNYRDEVSREFFN